MDNRLKSWFDLNETILRNPKNNEDLKNILKRNLEMKQQMTSGSDNFCITLIENMKGFGKMVFDNPNHFSSGKL